MLFFFRSARIGVLQLYGTLGSSIKAHLYEPIFEVLGKDRRTKAIVLDIDSPGGSVSASEQLSIAVSKTAQKKPVVAFVRGLGTSGSYMVACGANKIIAQPAALLGSIGVISIRPILEELLQRLGMSVSINKGGRLKDMGAFWRKPTDEESQKFQAIIDHFYDYFIARVAQARKLDKEKVRALATGEVFTASKALELGLIDEVADMDRALDMAAEMGRVPRRPIYIRPRRGLFHRLFGGMSESLVNAISNEIEGRILARFFYM